MSGHTSLFLLALFIWALGFEFERYELWQAFAAFVVIHACAEVGAWLVTKLNI